MARADEAPHHIVVRQEVRRAIVLAGQHATSERVSSAFAGTVHLSSSCQGTTSFFAGKGMLFLLTWQANSKQQIRYLSLHEYQAYDLLHQVGMCKYDASWGLTASQYNVPLPQGKLAQTGPEVERCIKSLSKYVLT